MSQRPDYHSQKIILEVAKKLALKLRDWGQPEELEDHLVETLTYSAPHYDGYEMAKHLDSEYSWSCDESLVDILGDAFIEANRLVRAATKEWVISNAVRAKKSIGDKVIVNTISKEGAWKDFEGEITAIDHDQATYTVLIESLGHVRDGLGCHGVVIKFEKVHDLALPPEEFELAIQ